MRDLMEFKKRNKYPHMKPADAKLIDRFIDKYPNAYTMVVFSFPVGDGAPNNPIVNEETEGSVEYLYQKKIDLVGFKGTSIDILEFRPKAGSSAVGNVLGYRDLFMRDERPGIKPDCIIVTDETNNDLDFVARKQGVKIVVV